MRADFYVYAYLREDGTPYYVGKGTGNRAFLKHAYVAVPPKDRIAFWQRDLTEEAAFYFEKAYIKLFGREDLGLGRLLNFTDGGQGVSGFKHSLESRKMMSEKHRGKQIFEDTKKKMSAAKRGKRKSEEHKKAVSRSKKGKSHPGVPRSPECRAKISAALKGKKKTRMGS